MLSISLSRRAHEAQDWYASIGCGMANGRRQKLCVCQKRRLSTNSILWSRIWMHSWWASRTVWLRSNSFLWKRQFTGAPAVCRQICNLQIYCECRARQASHLISFAEPVMALIFIGIHFSFSFIFSWFCSHLPYILLTCLLVYLLTCLLAYLLVLYSLFAFVFEVFSLCISVIFIIILLPWHKAVICTYIRVVSSVPHFFLSTFIS